MPRKRQLRRLRRLWALVFVGLSVAMVGLVGVFASLGVTRHPQDGNSGGLLGLAASAALLALGLGLVVWEARREPGINTEEHERLKAEGLDDGLPLGVYVEQQRIGLEPTDFLLVVAGFFVCLGVFFVSLLIFEPRDGTLALLGIAVLIGFLPALLCLQLASGTRLWLTPEGIESDRWPRKSMRWADVARIVPLDKNSPCEVRDAQLLDLQSTDAVNGYRRWRGRHFTIRVMLLQVEPQDLLPLLQQRLPDRPQDAVR